MAISIHSTTRVETQRRQLRPIQKYDFNPLHHEGGDLYLKPTSCLYCNFNPLHHEGGDCFFQSISPPALNFNPLHHEGGDLRSCIFYTYFQISIHSTTRVETPFQFSFVTVLSDFNPLHHEGGDCADQWLPVVVQYFNPLHHEGGDQRPQQNRLCLSIFQSTPPRGWRRKRGTFYGKINRFQSTPPRGWRQIKVKRNTVATYISIHSTTRVET